MQNRDSSYLPAQILIIHMSHKERFCGKGIRLHFYICSCNLKTRFIHTHLLKISQSCKQYITITTHLLCYQKKKKKLFWLLCKHLSIRKYVSGIHTILEKIMTFKCEINRNFPFIHFQLSIYLSPLPIYLNFLPLTSDSAIMILHCLNVTLF